jgi:hypothetical protein
MLSLSVLRLASVNTEALKKHVIVSVEGIVDLMEMVKVTAKSPEEGARASISDSSGGARLARGLNVPVRASRYPGMPC